MAYGTVSWEKRVKENIKNYRLVNLYEMEDIQEQMITIRDLTGLEILLTDRHGEKMVSVGNFVGFEPDVVEEPGRKLRVCNRTIGHIYVRTDRVDPGKKEVVERMFEQLVNLLENLGEKVYLHKESSVYLDELEVQVEKEKYRVKHGEKEDALTGTLNKTYFENRLRILDRAEVVPAAVIEVNINDWKFANDHFGDEESDRLIRVIAGIIKDEAKPDYVIGRVDGDVFHVVIPMPQDGEPEDYVTRIQEKCRAFEDDKLAPSIAVGMVVKTNVEQKLQEVFTDAQYEMLNNKLEMKQEPGYRERLEKGLA